VALNVKVRKIQRAKEAKIAIYDHPSLANPREYPHKSGIGWDRNAPERRSGSFYNDRNGVPVLFDDLERRAPWEQFLR